MFLHIKKEMILLKMLVTLQILHLSKYKEVIEEFVMVNLIIST